MKRCFHASSQEPTGLLLSRYPIGGLCPGHQARVLPALSRRSGGGEDEEPETHHLYRLPDFLDWHSDSPMGALDDVVKLRQRRTEGLIAGNSEIIYLTEQSES